MLTAPACGECQQRLQPDEEYFRTLAASGAYRDPSARKLWDTKIVRSFSNSPAFRRSLEKAIKTVELRSPGGIILGAVTGLEGNQERLGNVLRKIVRGLFYLDSGGTVMPFDVKFNYEQLSPMSPPMPEAVMGLIHSMPLRMVGGVVQYKFELCPEEPRMIVSWMAFYGRTMFAVWTWPDDLELPLDPEARARLAHS